MIESTTITTAISGIEVIALKKLSLVSHALADKIGGRAGQEQTTLAITLDNLVRQIELNAAKAAKRMTRSGLIFTIGSALIRKKVAEGATKSEAAPEGPGGPLTQGPVATEVECPAAGCAAVNADDSIVSKAMHPPVTPGYAGGGC